MTSTTAPLSPIDAVLFDYGNVLSGPPNHAAWARMRTITGFREEDLHREYWAPRHAYDRGTHTGEEYWQLIAQEMGGTFSADQVTALIAADNDLWTDPNLPMIAWAGELQQAGIRTGILSNLGDAMAAGLLAKFDWIGAFDHCTWSHELKLAKPEAAIYHHAAKGLGTSPARTLFIDDRADNIEGARSYGMQAIQYLNHAEFLAEMELRGYGDLLHPASRSHSSETVNESN